MRAGLYSMQQALTPEAASMVKQAVSLARRRGHAHVTPLHLASAMLASSTGLLRRACLQSHSHPLQLKALELCFNVALNRLPTSTSSPLFGHQSSYPSVSNALVAALKRAQAHQRRGTSENQQQTILALKVELEQLIISVLDDPSVSRVMREAGFSSPLIKNKVEQAVSLEICSQTSTSISSLSKGSSKTIFLGSSVPQSLPFSRFAPTISTSVEKVGDEDVKSVLDSMLKKERNTVIVGECLASSEAVVKSVLEKFDKGDDIPGSLRYVQFVNLPLSSLRNIYKDDVEQKILELRCLVKNYAARGVVLYLGDLKWISDFWSNYGEQRRSYYCPVEHIIMEIKRLVCEVQESEKLWLIGISTFQTYMRCKAGHPSLESLWDLHPLTIPVGSLCLSLSLDSSDLETQCESKISKDGTCRPLLGSNAHGIESSVQNKDSTTTKSTIGTSTSSSLPLWLQQYKDESIRNTTRDQEYTNVTDPCKRWDSFSSSVNNNPSHPKKTLNFSASPSPCSSNTCSGGNNKDLYQTSFSWSAPLETKQVPKVLHQFWIYESKPELFSNPNSSPNSASSSEVEEDVEGDMFKEFSAENLKILCNALERKVPWQRDLITDIVSTVLKCRSGMAKPKQREIKEETWLFFLGFDNEGKDKIARELARVVFGSQSNFISVSLSCFASTRADSTEEYKNKRSRHEPGCSYIERFGEAVNENPHRVFFIEDIEQADYHSQKGIKNAIQSGKITLNHGEKVPLKDAIIIFSCESLSSISRACSPPRNQDDQVETQESVSLDINIGIHDNHASELPGGEIGILDSVDRQIMFKVQEL